MYIQIDLASDGSSSVGGGGLPSPPTKHSDDKHEPEAINFNAGDTENG